MSMQLPDYAVKLAYIIDNTAYPKSSGSLSEFVLDDDDDASNGADEVEQARDSESRPHKPHARGRKNVQLQEHSQPIPTDSSDFTIDGCKATNDEAEYIRTYFHMRTLSSDA